MTPTLFLSCAATLAAFCSGGCVEESVPATTNLGPDEINWPSAWYPLNDPTAPGRDHSAQHHDALAVSFDVLPDPTRGEVAAFNGGALLMRPPVQRDFSISLWLKTSQMGPDSSGWSSGPRIVDADVPGAGSTDFGVGLALDKLAFGLGNPADSIQDATAIKSQRVVVDGSWHHIALTRDGSAGMAQIFIDGTLDATRQCAIGDLMLPETVNLGDLGHTSPASPPLHAEISDVRFYNRVLSAAAIQFLAAL